MDQFKTLFSERERAKDDESLHDAINRRLDQDNLENIGKLKREVAESYLPVDCDKIRILKDKNHKLSITCVVVSADNRFIFSASKDAGLLKWRLDNGEKLHKLPGGRKGMETKHKGHCTTINAMAVSSDGKFLVKFLSISNLNLKIEKAKICFNKN